MSTMAEHYDEMTLLLYLEEQLEAARVREIAAHMRDCPACGALLRSLQHEGLWLRDSLTAEDESIPARLLAAPAGADVPWGWVMSLGMGAAGIYGLWSGVVEPWQARFSQAGFTQGSLLSMLFFSGALWKGWGEMTSLVEILATAGVLLIVAMLLRHNWRRWTTVGVVMGTLAFSLATPPAAMAGQYHNGEPNYTLPRGQTIDTDLFVTADTVRIDGDVSGDLYAFAHNVIVNGHVSGDVLGFAQSLQINGRVDGNVRTWSQTLTVVGSVAKNLLVGADTFELDPKGTVGGSVTAFAGQISLDGPVGRDVLAKGGHFSLDNKIGGNLEVSADDIFVGSDAQVAGKMTYKGNKAPNIDSGAKIAGPVQAKYEEHVSKYKTVHYYWHIALSWAASLLFGLVMILAIPAFYRDVQRALDRVGMSGGMGFLAVAGVPFAAIIACITIVGLAVGISTILLYCIGLYSAHVFVGAWIGRKILGEAGGNGALFGRLALGLAILSAVRVVPWVGAMVGAIVVLWGAGAIAITVYQRMRPVLAAA
jgi:cytoskeletal protein CcmA (bactofilin family)